MSVSDTTIANTVSGLFANGGTVLATVSRSLIAGSSQCSSGNLRRRGGQISVDSSSINGNATAFNAGVSGRSSASRTTISTTTRPRIHPAVRPSPALPTIGPAATVRARRTERSRNSKLGRGPPRSPFRNTSGPRRSARPASFSVICSARQGRSQSISRLPPFRRSGQEIAPPPVQPLLGYEEVVPVDDIANLVPSLWRIDDVAEQVAGRVPAQYRKVEQRSLDVPVS